MKYFSYCVFKAWQINGILHENCYAFVVISATVTFICNLYSSSVSLLNTHKNFITSKDVQGFVIVLGWIVSFILNIIVNLWESCAQISYTAVILISYVFLTCLQIFG
jgi:hypothetical protein